MYNEYNRNKEKSQLTEICSFSDHQTLKFIAYGKGNLTTNFELFLKKMKGHGDDDDDDIDDIIDTVT